MGEEEHTSSCRAEVEADSEIGAEMEAVRRLLDSLKVKALKSRDNLLKQITDMINIRTSYSKTTGKNNISNKLVILKYNMYY